MKKYLAKPGVRDNTVTINDLNMLNLIHGGTSKKLYDSQKSSPRQSNVLIRIAGKGEVLGFEDVVKGRNHTFSVRCISQKGIVFRIDKAIFLNAINSNE